MSFLAEYVEILTDPAHVAAEVTFTAAVDLIGIGLIKRLVLRAVRREHAAIDGEQGLSHAADAVLVRRSARGPETLLGRRRDDGLLCWPGGRVEPGESPVGAARRGLWEEVGFRIRRRPARMLWSGTDLTTPEWVVHVALWRVPRALTRLGRLRPQPAEMTWAGWVPVADRAEQDLSLHHRPILALLRKQEGT